MRLASRADRQRPPARLNDAQGKSTQPENAGTTTITILLSSSRLHTSYQIILLIRMPIFILFPTLSISGTKFVLACTRSSSGPLLSVITDGLRNDHTNDDKNNVRRLCLRLKHPALLREERVQIFWTCMFTIISRGTNLKNWLIRLVSEAARLPSSIAFESPSYPMVRTRKLCAGRRQIWSVFSATMLY